MNSDEHESHPLDIPTFLRRDVSKRVELMNSTEQQVEVEEAPKPAKVKKAKPAKKPEVKAKPKAVKAKAAKAPEKAKVAKPKAEKDLYGLRKGSSRSEAAAMYARKSGATLEEVKAKLGSIQLNVLNDLEEAGWPVEREKLARKGMRPVTRYFLRTKK